MKRQISGIGSNSLDSQQLITFDNSSSSANINPYSRIRSRLLKSRRRQQGPLQSQQAQPAEELEPVTKKLKSSVNSSPVGSSAVQLTKTAKAILDVLSSTKVAPPMRPASTTTTTPATTTTVTTGMFANGYVKPAGWNCSICCVDNEPSAAACVCCETPAPNAKPQSKLETQKPGMFLTQTPAKSGKWDCSVCLVDNSPTAMKCVCCEAPNPNAPASAQPAAPSFGATGGFSFGASSASTTTGSSGFSFPVSAPTTAPTTGGFKFPVSSSTEQSSSAGGFKFPSTTAAVAESTPSGFKFPAVPSNPSVPSTGGFQFGAASSTPSVTSTGFKFGSASPSPSKEPNVSATPATSSGFSFNPSSSSSPAAMDTSPGQTSSSSATTGFAFGSTSPAKSATPPVQLSSTKTPEKQQTSGFSFASPDPSMTPTASCTTPAFSFNSTNAPAVTPDASLFQPKSTFQFGTVVKAEEIKFNSSSTNLNPFAKEYVPTSLPSSKPKPAASPQPSSASGSSSKLIVADLPKFVFHDPLVPAAPLPSISLTDVKKYEIKF